VCTVFGGVLRSSLLLGAQPRVAVRIPSPAREGSEAVGVCDRRSGLEDARKTARRRRGCARLGLVHGRTPGSLRKPRNNICFCLILQSSLTKYLYVIYNNNRNNTLIIIVIPIKKN
jgi:hypothetical protein